jgi:tetratricopeptide (TPR) repeat protein
VTRKQSIASLCIAGAGCILVSSIPAAASTPDYKAISSMVAHERYNDALAETSRIISADPNAFVAYMLRSQVLVELDRPKEALADCKRAWAFGVKYDCAPLHDTAAKSYISIEDFGSALTEATKAVKLGPSADRWRLKGQIYNQLKKYEDAVNCYSEAIKLAPKNFWMYMDRAGCYAKLNKTKEAIADYTQVIKLAPTEPSAYVFRAKLYEKLGQNDLARKDREQAGKRTEIPF